MESEKALSKFWEVYKTFIEAVDHYESPDFHLMELARIQFSFLNRWSAIYQLLGDQMTVEEIEDGIWRLNNQFKSWRVLINTIGNIGK